MPNLTNTPKIINKIGDKVNASDLGRVAFTNQYSDLDGIPSQTVVNNATVTFKKNGTTVQTITNNQASDAEVNYEITKTDVGLGNVDNTADINKPVSNAVSVELGKKANKTDVYTKAETDAAISASISSVYKYKGSKANLAQIQAIVEKENGDVWNAEDTDINYAWNGSRWDPLGGTVDLSGYLTKSEASTTYLPTANAAALYLTKIDAANTYLPSDTASNTYLSKSEASNTYATNDSVSNTYLSKFDAANTYATNAGVDNTYLSKSDAANTYLSQSSASQNYATKSEVAEAVESIDGVSTTQPENPEAGSVYYDTTENVLKIYNGNEWIVAGEGQDHIVLTRQEYDALTPEEKADPNKIYFIKGGQSGITVEWSNVIGRPTALSDFTNDTGFITSSDVLTKNNTTAFTPSTDYQPATKKYVDDAVAAGGGGGASVSDEAYSSSWNGVSTIAPSKNVVYDKISSIDSNISSINSNVSGLNTRVQTVEGSVSSMGTSKQDTLVSGTNIKTVNGNSLLGSGNIDIVSSGVQWTNKSGSADLNLQIVECNTFDVGGQTYYIDRNKTTIKQGSVEVGENLEANAAEYATLNPTYIEWKNYQGVTSRFEFTGNGNNKIARLSDLTSLSGIITTQPQNPIEGSIYYDTTNDVLKIYDGTNWIEVGGSSEVEDLKLFYINGTTDLTNAQAAYNYWKSGKTPILYFTGDSTQRDGIYTLVGEYGNDLGLAFIGSGLQAPEDYQPGGLTGYSTLSVDSIFFRKNSGDNPITQVNYGKSSGDGRFLDPLKNYEGTYTPLYNGSPATKKYVDDSVAGISVPTKVSDLTNDSGYQTASDVTSLISESTYVGSSAPSNPTEGMIWYDTTTNILKTYDGTNWNITSDFPGMTILEYGVSTWQDFVNADNINAIVYCKVPSATGLRMAFLAYQNTDSGQETAEFQYYRSTSSKSDSAQGDEVYIYKLTPDNGGTWTTSTRKTYSKIVAGTNMTSSYASGTLTLNANSQIDNTAYDSSWSSDTTHAPSKSAVYAALGDIITLLDNI